MCQQTIPIGMRRIRMPRTSVSSFSNPAPYHGVSLTFADLPLWGKPFKTLLLTRQGQQDFLTSMGLDIVSETFGFFQPDNPVCGQEHQQYVIAQRRNDDPLSPPKPLPTEGRRG